jgi:hypothetical protein
LARIQKSSGQKCLWLSQDAQDNPA